MLDLSPEFGLISIGIAALAILGFLFALATRVREETTIHDLRVRVYDMRIHYLRKLIETYKNDPGESDVEIVMDDESDNSTSVVVEPEQRQAA
ncbi:MAG: hypothetical protein KF757_07725 [Phycisphaeraceae bacterium]|nr:hypothetical protein [Phycisphaeraceae bacterium]MCW5762646.1 hypothetical protein [Phycisphaeraceae bacterium]